MFLLLRMNENSFVLSIFFWANKILSVGAEVVVVVVVVLVGEDGVSLKSKIILNV